MQQLMLAVLTLAALWAPSRFIVSSVTVSPDTLALAYGDRGLLTATCRNAYGDVVYCVGGIKWTVRDTGKVFRITTTGNLVEARGRATGTTWIVAKPLTGTADSSKVVVTSGPPGPQPPTTPPTPTTIVMTPASVSLASGTTQAFTVQGFTSTGVQIAVSPSFSATGGSISVGGVYTAGSTAGSFRAIATVGSLADTSIITIPATLVQLILSPSSASLPTGGASQQFTVSGLLSNGQTTTAVVPTWSATGGTVSTGGLYVSGASTGTFRVIAASSGVADTAVITLTAPIACSGTPVSPGQSIQAAVTANANGATICILAGTHTTQSVTPKQSNTFRCEAGAILDGQNTTQYAFKRNGSNPDSVRIVGCEIKNYNPPAQMGAILAGGALITDATDAWMLDSLRVHDNANAGIRVGTKTKVRWSYVYHNGTIGITGVGDSILIYGDSVYDNNPSGGGLGFESGATKFAMSNNTIVRKSFFVNNIGPAIWFDICNRGFLVDSNTSTDNLGEGIVAEISYNGIIRHNTVIRNGLNNTSRTSWPWGAGIGVHSGGGTGVEIYGNTVTGNAHGIALIQQNRGTPPGGAQCTTSWIVQNVNVHDNTITAGPGTLTLAGAVQDVSDNAIFTSRNNHFEDNDYFGVSSVPTSPMKPFTWSNLWLTQSGWTATGNDTPGGTFTP